MSFLVKTIRLSNLIIYIIEKGLLYIRISNKDNRENNMKIDKSKLTIQILAIIGFALTIKLAMIYYVANFQKYALPSFCTINEFIDCDGAARTTTAQFWGIPLAYWGMFFYITILFLTIVDKLKNIKIFKFLEVFKNPKSYIAILGSFAFIISMILAGISVFRIQKLCILCVLTYFIDLTIALVACENVINDLKNTFFDFIDGVKNYTKTFITLLILACTFLVYTGTQYPFTPQIKKIKEFQRYHKMKVNPYRVKGNTLGNEKADVVIELYSDYVCPLCYVHNIMLHKAVKEYSNIKIIHHNYPFDKECNPYIGVNMHPNACFMAKGAIAAKNQGNYWEMSSLLYEKQPKTIEDMLKLAKKLNFNEDKFLQDFEAEKTYAELETELKNGNSLGIDATPTMIINGNQHVGVMEYKNLQELLEKYGAKKR